MPSFPKPDHCDRKATHDRKAKAWRDAAWLTHGFKNNSGQQVGVCARCKVFVVRGENGTVDHVQPRSTHPERKYDPSNARLVCAKCNRWLKDHPLERDL